MFLENAIEAIAKEESSAELLLEQLVTIDSQVGNTLGILRVQNFLQDYLKDLNFNTLLINNQTKETAPLLLAHRPGRVGRQTITFIGHSDVVTSPAKNPYRIEGNRIYGSGVADDKGGVVVCLSSLESFLMNHHNHHFNINVVISPNEETGSIGFHDLFRKLGEESDYIFGLEPALQCGSVITSRSGNRWYQLKAKGIASHAGRFGHNYINAAHKLSKIIAKLHEFNDEDQKRRVNVGSFHGGNGGFNTICDEAWAKIDVRFSNFECRSKLHFEIEKVLHEEKLICPYSEQESSLYYSIEDDCPPLPSPQEECGWYQVYRKLVSSYERKNLEGKHAGGAADINYFAYPNKNLLDGLGPVGGGLHTKHEYIERDSLHTRSQALSGLLTWINDTHFIGRRDV